MSGAADFICMRLALRPCRVRRWGSIPEVLRAERAAAPCAKGYVQANSRLSSGKGIARAWVVPIN